MYTISAVGYPFAGGAIGSLIDASAYPSNKAMVVQNSDEDADEILSALHDLPAGGSR